MKHHRHCAALPVQLFREVKHLNLVGNIKVGGRLIQQDQRGLLRQRHSDPHALPLPTRKRLNGSFRQLQHIRRLHRLNTGCLILSRPGT